MSGYCSDMFMVVCILYTRRFFCFFFSLPCLDVYVCLTVVVMWTNLEINLCGINIALLYGVHLPLLNFILPPQNPSQ